MNAPRPRPAAEMRLLGALGLASAAATAQQIALMQVLGWMHWHHFAYMIVAVALLGFGIAGTVLSLARQRLVRHWMQIVPWCLLAAALALPLGVRLAQQDFFAVDLALVFFAPANTWRLAALCVGLVPPFFCAGLVTGLVLTAHAREAGRYYAASLAGAGIGGLVGLALVSYIAPPRLPVAVALLALAAAACLWPRLARAARAGTLVVFTILAALSWWPGELRASEFKPLRRTLDLPGARVIAERPGVHGWVQIVDAPALRPAPAVSLQFGGEIPPQRAVFVNGLGYGTLPAAEHLAAPAWLEHTTDAAPFAVRTPRRVLLLENGPGGWSALARHAGATEITVVEPNVALVDMLLTGAPPLAPEWRLPGVAVATTTGRAFLRRTPGAFDVIRFPTVGALGGTAGFASATEQFLLTRQAFADAWRQLAPGGILAVTAWMDFPERNPLRLLATLAEMLETAGASPRSHLAAVRGWATVTFLARRPETVGLAAWTSPDLEKLRAFGAERGFDLLLLPGLDSRERETHHAWQNPDFFRHVDALVDGPRENVYQDYEFDVRPASDARPYFSQFLRPAAWRRIDEAFGARTMPFFELGSFVVALTFLVLAALAVAGIALPLVARGWHAQGKASVLLYFAGLGAGFMLVEIGLMLRATAWLGSPVLAAALVLTILLVASGVGSAWSERLATTPRTARRAVATIAVVILAVAAVLARAGQMAQYWPAAVSHAVLIGSVGIAGFALGTAFPLGLRRLEASAPEHVAWAWAVNGCVSVATPAGAMLLAMQAGFGALFLAAAVAYGVAFAGAMLSVASARRSRSGPG